MGILERFGVRDMASTFRRPEDPKPAAIEIGGGEAVDVAPVHNGYTYEHAHRTVLKAEVIWYANTAQYNQRRELAHRELIELMYAPVLDRLTRIEARAMDRDWGAVLEQVAAIREELKP